MNMNKIKCCKTWAEHVKKDQFCTQQGFTLTLKIDERTGVHSPLIAIGGEGEVWRKGIMMKMT